MEISVVVPVFNEAENIEPLLHEIVDAMGPSSTYEIIYIDDGSNDQSPQILQQAAQRITNLRVLRHRQSRGQSAAIHSGVMAARYNIIATLDGDGQNDPADIPRLWQVFQQQRSENPSLWMIAGWRKQRNDSAWRRISSKIANSVRSTLLHDNTPDTGCGLKLFLRDQFLLLPYFNHMHRFLPALMIRNGGQVISESVNHRGRTNGQSKYGTLDRLLAGIIDLLGVMWLNHRAKNAEVEVIGND
ncbi:glycosyltransferase family 2 protein [Methylomarinum vadi]|uniref:glycosyltransferase family 2 protein n=1 Tax=Methylomarinum vadi TaxID=438855 RepID=UPI0004DF0A36|nr:glycosyltransferase family 2 protein [Methylomarinum vadi]